MRAQHTIAYTLTEVCTPPYMLRETSPFMGMRISMYLGALTYSYTNACMYALVRAITHTHVHTDTPMRKTMHGPIPGQG